MTTQFNSPNIFYSSSFNYPIHPIGPSFLSSGRKAFFIALYSHLKIKIFIMAASMAAQLL
jgi:hypothetical protein